MKNKSRQVLPKFEFYFIVPNVPLEVYTSPLSIPRRGEGGASSLVVSVSDSLNVKIRSIWHSISITIHAHHPNCLEFSLNTKNITRLLKSMSHLLDGKVISTGTRFPYMLFVLIVRNAP